MYNNNAGLWGVTAMLSLNLIQDIMDVNSIKEVQDLLHKHLYRFDIPYFNYGVQIPSIHKKEEPYIISGYDNKWISHYIKNRYIEIDSTVLYSIYNIAPLIWTDNHFKSCSKMRDESKDAGLLYGATYPIHGARGEKGLFCISSENEITKEAFLEINALIPFLHNKIYDIDLHNHCYFSVPKLTTKEQEFLKWMALGKTNEDISLIMNISYRTCIDYTNKLVKKFNCHNKFQVVSMVIMKGIVQL